MTIELVTCSHLITFHRVIDFFIGVWVSRRGLRSHSRINQIKIYKFSLFANGTEQHVLNTNGSWISSFKAGFCQEL